MSSRPLQSFSSERPVRAGAASWFAMAALDEVDALIDALRPTAESERRRDAVLQYVRECLHAHARLRGARCCVTGSFALKTYLPESDIDMTLLLPPADAAAAEGGAPEAGGDADEEWVVAVSEALCRAAMRHAPVSYTHLTLPTILLV